MNFKNLKIGQKIIVGYIFAGIMGLTIGISGITAMANLDDSFNSVANKSLPSVYYMGDMEHSITKIYESFLDLSNPNLTRLQREQVVKDIELFREGLQTTMKKFSRLDIADEEKKMYDNLTNDLKEWRKIDQQILELNTAFMQLGIMNPTKTKGQIEEFMKDHYDLQLKVSHSLENKRQFVDGESSKTCQFAQWFTTFDTTDTIMSSYLEQIKPYHNSFHNAVYKIKSLLKKGQFQEARDHYNKLMIPIAQKLFNSFYEIENGIKKSQKILNQIIEISENEMGSQYKKFNHSFTQLKSFNTNYVRTEKSKGTQTFNSNMLLIIFTIIVGMSISFILSFLITRSITRGLGQGVALAQRIAEGNLSVDLSSNILNQKDEVGQLANALQNMVNQLKKIISDIINSSESISGAGQEMSLSSQQLSQGASEQASSAEEISSSMEEMVANIQQNTENAIETKNMATQASEEIRKANKSSASATNAMQEIAANVSIIEDIALKTNILALNAAVEAAHAGEQAQGFTVIAKEIRNLAEKSRIAANKIDQLAKQGVVISEEASKQLSAIVPNIEKTANLVQEIAVSGLEQQSGADQINSAIQLLNQVIQQNAAASEELASGSEELSGQVHHMKEMVSYFRVQ
ncbi:methyl-accepting chemotaxis protein [Thermophagus sp. OGC60D27]|uniref:methyl-accepting chemotaxis protein n=1 Tax=Thermophagus sp. OGC60D27 TaxID=3458415 RepID=UPI004037C70D